MAKREQTFLINNEREIVLSGRPLWCMEQLLKAGSKGITSLENPAPRLSGYIHRLRSEYDVLISTEHETHGGEWARNHARYRLESQVEILKEVAA
ncbi:MAG: hypothetical protein QNJ29_09920 [Rhizobiaceae bacterium]|nr:hypothetical protein [Rhizobiaceae bacterium]